MVALQLYTQLSFVLMLVGLFSPFTLYLVIVNPNTPQGLAQTTSIA